MSTMLEQAIIDAEALKDAAIRNAEMAIIEKYSTDIKEAVDQLLEQPEEMPPLGGGEETEEESEFAKSVPDAHADGEDLCPCPEEEEEVEIDFDELSRRIKADEEDMGTGEMVGREEFGEEELGLSEEISISEEDLHDLLETEDSQEKLEEEDLDEEEDLEERTKTSDVAVGKAAGGRRVKDPATGQLVSEELNNLRQSLKNLSEKMGSLKDENSKYRKLTSKLQTRLQEVNLSNAKLLYINRTLDSSSLNERQKKIIVEAISKAGSVEESKTIFETLQSTVGSASTRKAPKSLNEVVTKRSSMFLPRREEKASNSNFAERMQTLAGIKKK